VDYTCIVEENNTTSDNNNPVYIMPFAELRGHWEKSQLCGIKTAF